jgi:hypothetical protein
MLAQAPLLVAAGLDQCTVTPTKHRQQLAAGMLPTLAQNSLRLQHVRWKPPAAPYKAANVLHGGMTPHEQHWPPHSKRIAGYCMALLSPIYCVHKQTHIKQP